MYKYLLLLYISSIGLTAAAQRQNTYFFNKNNGLVKEKDSAFYVRIVQEPAPENPQVYIVNEFYVLDGAKKSTGFSSKTEPISYEGKYVSYFQNGNKRSIINFKNGERVDTLTYFYPNGHIFYQFVHHYNPSSKETLIYVKSVKDSTGKDLVVEGNGKAIFYDEQFDVITGRGNIKNGAYDGIWTGYLPDEKLSYKDTYVEGQLISGESKDEQNKIYLYTNIKILPEFKGGMNAFYEFLNKNLTYPRSMLEMGISGKVVLQFTVKTDGKLSDIKVVNNAEQNFAIEALRTLKLSPDWTPAQVRGKLVDMLFNLPIVFNVPEEKPKRKKGRN
ncbi:TonB family protein [Pedobacter immunditicola]|uniref:TonB family protein n=1 Tax=Pedobacter immunditicola TaxID=3133440 RepID=UPI0030982563